MPPKVVLVTGVGGFLGGHLAGQLAADPDIDRVVGVDTAAPPPDVARAMGRAEFVRADIRNPLIGKVLSAAKVDTVVHASLTSHPPGPSGRLLHKEMNVIGTMQLLAACQKTPTLRKLVVKSTAEVYGSGPRESGVLTEDMTPAELPSSGYARDNAEVESYVRGFGRRRSDVGITTLRFTNLIGPTVDTVLTRYFALPVVPTVLGYDARLQLLHSEDALAAIVRASTADLPGVYNVGGDGVLMLSQAIRRAGRVPMPVPGSVVQPISRLFRSTRLVDFGSEQLRYLNFGRVVDTTKLKAEFGFTPRWSTVAAFDDYVSGRRERRGGGPTVRAAPRTHGRPW
ncbi:MAG: NAD-dependent epimerase/dehydratase family protein [Sciscionella sp.]